LIPQSKESQPQDARRGYAKATSGEEEEEEADVVLGEKGKKELSIRGQLNRRPL
jgi:hypothetical protein